MIAQPRPLIEVFSDIADFRKSRGKRHPLSAILALACCAMLCGYRSYSAIAEWGRNYGTDIARALGFTHNTPCASTLHTILRCIDREAFEAKVGAWAESVVATAPAAPEAPEIAMAVDGKTLRGSKKQGAPETHLISVLAHRAGLTLTIHEDAQQEAAKLDGCSVLKTDLTPAQAPKELVHDRYKDLACVEQAFRSCKTVHLEVRPIFLRLEERTRAHALVVMLAYQIIRYLASCWSAFDVTVAEGLHALTTLCLVEVAPHNAPSYHCIPTPRDALARLLHSADITLPKAFALSGVRVSTKKKMQSERLVQ